jgi:hypothetical protein
LTLEPILDDAPEDLKPGRPSTTRAIPSRDARSSSARPPVPESVSPGATPLRSTVSRFGRFLGAPGPAGERADGGSSIKVEPRSDPAAEALVKRRVGKQIEQSLGDRVRSVEISVSGRTVLIRAQAARFWQRRSVRRSLEAISLPTGYRSKVEIVD